MARLPRLVLPGELHLVLHRGQSGDGVFRDDADRSGYLAALRDGLADQSVDLHAYALLGNGVRLLLTPKAAGGLGGLMQFIGRRFVPAFNRKYARRGTPWEGRFRSTVVESPRYFAPCLRFVEWAPAASTLAHDAEEWSSRPHHLGSRVDPLITEHAAFFALGNTPFEREAAYRRYGEQSADSGELAGILHAAMHGWALGTAAFVDALGARAGRRVQPAAPGRPRKLVQPPEGNDMSPIT